MQSNQSAAVGSSSRLAPTGKVDAVGLDSDVEAVKERIFNNNKKLQILPIVGTGGIGKTTLARNVYHHPSIIESFSVRAWVTLSQDYSFGDVFSNLLAYMKDFVKEEISMLTKNEMAEKVYQTLIGRRYLIVIDDMWSTKAWNEIKRFFPDSSNGSRIILTTRLEDVAVYAASSSPLHSMQFMSVDQSWDLLKKEALKGKDLLPWMEEIGRKIAESCGGLPLAIVVVAGLLSQVSQTKDDWEGISDNINLAISADEEKYAAILSLSYTHLPNHLKPCFLYMGAFPEDYDIRVSKLVKLWMAEGFVESNGTRTLEEAAGECLEDLVKRNLVLVTKRKLNGRIKSCGLHDLVRDLCQIKSLEENFFLCFMGLLFVPGFFENQRRTSISSSNIVSQIDGSTICTIICFGHGSIDSFEKFGSLKVLDILNTNIPAQVFDLHDLKLLAYKYSTPIPSSISNLENLQTLTCYPNDKCMVSLPDEIWKMPQLRHLISSSFHPLPEPEESTLPLENLQTLSVITNFVCSKRMVDMIPNIKKLGICYSVDKIDVDYHLKNLERFHHLEKLKLKTEGGKDFAYGSRLNPVFPESLRELTFCGWWYSWEDLNIIGSLPNLSVLKLRNYACDGTTWETTEGEFEQLEFLLVDESNLKEWLTESSHFPKLKTLVLRRCPLLSEIPNDIGCIPTLELIEVDNENLMESAKKIQDDQEMEGNYSIQVRNSSVFSTHQEREFADDLLKSIAGGLVDHSVSNYSEQDDILLHDVVGLDEDRDRIVNRLIFQYEDDPFDNIMSIVGMGGSGKTTLARIVYNDDRVKQCFQVRVWVTLPQDYSVALPKDYSVERFFSELADQIRVSPLYTEGDTSMYLWYVKFLIVIDNLWDKNIWRDVERCIPSKSDGSKILITTRLNQVAVYARTVSYAMRFLDDDQSWHLFERKLFVDRVCPLELQAIGKKIVKSCGGLPLSIVRVAQLLSRVPLKPKFWEKIAESDGKLETTPFLSLDHLPHHLKECFLYMAGFPEDYEIRASEIVKLWMAEGFLRDLIQEKSLEEVADRLGYLIRNKSLEEMAEYFLEDLVKRSLVLVISRKLDGKIKSCRLHNTVREFCIREAGQQKFMLPVMDYSRSPIIRRHFLPRVLEYYKRISASWYDLDLKDSMHSSCTQTIICIPQNGYRPKGSVRNFTSLKVLHVLRRRNDRSYWDLGEVFDHTNLTYLASNIPSSIVPPAISKLQNLQSLIIYRSEVYLPQEIWTMPQLRHLMAFSCHPLPDPEDADPPLENLQTLSLATEFVCSERMVVMIPNIKKLGLRYSGEKVEGGYHLDNIAQFLQLEKLKLEMPNSFLPSVPIFPWSLIKLNLSGGRLPWEEMDIICSLPNLQVLKLRNHACDGEVWETDYRVYSNLRTLLIDESNLVNWTTGWSHFPRLDHLILLRCPYLSQIPSDIGENFTLKLVEVDDLNEDLLQSARVILKRRQDWPSGDSFEVHVRHFDTVSQTWEPYRCLFSG